MSLIKKKPKRKHEETNHGSTRKLCCPYCDSNDISIMGWVDPNDAWLKYTPLDQKDNCWCNECQKHFNYANIGLKCDGIIFKGEKKEGAS